MAKVGQGIHFLYTHFKFWRTYVFFEVGHAYLCFVKQEVTEKFWPRKYTYWSVIMVIRNYLKVLFVFEDFKTK